MDDRQGKAAFTCIGHLGRIGFEDIPIDLLPIILGINMRFGQFDERNVQRALLPKITGFQNDFQGSDAGERVPRIGIQNGNDGCRGWGWSGSRGRRRCCERARSIRSATAGRTIITLLARAGHTAQRQGQAVFSDKTVGRIGQHHVVQLDGPVRKVFPERKVDVAEMHIRIHKTHGISVDDARQRLLRQRPLDGECQHQYQSQQ